jgi:hypothetical protein
MLGPRPLECTQRITTWCRSHQPPCSDPGGETKFGVTWPPGIVTIIIDAGTHITGGGGILTVGADVDPTGKHG